MVDLLDNLNEVESRAPYAPKERLHRDTVTILRNLSESDPTTSPNPSSRLISRVIPVLGDFAYLRKAFVVELPESDAAWKKFLTSLLAKLPEEVTRILEGTSGDTVTGVAVYVVPDQPPQHEKLNNCPTYYLVFKFGPQARGPPVEARSNPKDNSKFI
jgi:hypothetical protein